MRIVRIILLIAAVACVASGADPLLASQRADQKGQVQAFSLEPDTPVLSHAYAFVKGDNIPVYKKPEDAIDGVPPVRHTKTGSIWVSFSDPKPIVYNQQVWYRINKDEYIRADHLRLAEPSGFKGIVMPEYFDADKFFAWLIFNTRLSPEPGVPAPYDAPMLPSRTLVIVEEMRKVDDRYWCRIGGGQWVEYTRVGMIRPSPRPAGVKKTERWIEINLFEQTLAAYEGDRLVYATLISSGMSDYPTVQGLFRIWVKARIAKMSGGEEGVDYYHLEDVPWQMYFHRSYALHGSYWHDYYGLPNSHGCVNLSPKDAQWLFDWVSPSNGSTNWQRASRHDPGTWVWVHE